MDLKNNKITVGELLANPKAKALFEREFPKVAKGNFVTIVKNTTLDELIVFAGKYISKGRISNLLEELRKI